MPLPLLAAIGAGSALIKGVNGFLQNRKANKLMREAVFPVEQANPLLAQNAAIAQNMARTGLPQQQYNNSLNNIMRNQAGALTSFARNPRGTNLASLLRASNDATMNLDAQDAGARTNNQRFSLGQNAALAQEQNRVWDWNNRQQYLMKLARAQALKGAAGANFNTALNEGSALGASLVGGATTDDIGALFKRRRDIPLSQRAGYTGVTQTTSQVPTGSLRL